MDSLSGLPPVRLPEQVYVPVVTADPHADETRFELRQAGDGEVLAPAYSSLDTIIDCCGDYQPWVLLPAHRLLELQRELGVDRIVLDLSLPPAERHGPAGRAS